MDETIDFIKSRHADIDDAFDQFFIQACSLLASVGVEEVQGRRNRPGRPGSCWTNILKEEC